MQLIDMMLGYLCLFSDPEFQNLRKGSPEELKKLYLHYKRPLINFLLIHLKGNKAAAKDILQETFEIVNSYYTADDNFCFTIKMI